MVIQKNWQALIKPQQLSVESGDDPKPEAEVAICFAEFELDVAKAELRRVLLSSLQGAAVARCKSMFHRCLIPGA